MPRIHHQLYPEYLFAETQFPITVLHELEKFGHKVNNEISLHFDGKVNNLFVLEQRLSTIWVI